MARETKEVEEELTPRDHLLAGLIKIILGWLMLIPVWWVMVDSIGVTDRMTGWVVNSWILLVPASITLMMLGMTVWFLWARRQLKLWEKEKDQNDSRR